jgi:hypothetical protein
MDAMKSTVDSKKTGRTETILGIQAEETESVITMSIPAPQGGAGFSTKLVMRSWNAGPEEVLRNQAVREFTGYNIWSNYFMNPVGNMQKIFGNMPAFADSFKVFYDAMSKNHTMLLRIRMEMFMRTDTPMFQVTTQAVELSSAPVEEAIFQVPAGYQAVPAEDLLKRFVAELTSHAAK